MKVPTALITATTRMSAWYLFSAALLIIRIPVTAVCIFWGIDLWLAVIVAWAVERPFYFYLAVYLNRRFER